MTIAKKYEFIFGRKIRSFLVFQVFKKFVEQETSQFMKCLRTDRGGEFKFVEFNKFCKQNGIQ